MEKAELELEPELEQKRERPILAKSSSKLELQLSLSIWNLIQIIAGYSFIAFALLLTSYFILQYVSSWKASWKAEMTERFLMYLSIPCLFVVCAESCHVITRAEFLFLFVMQTTMFNHFVKMDIRNKNATVPYAQVTNETDVGT